MNEEEFRRLQQIIEPIIAKWQMPSGTTIEDLIADTIFALWFAIASGKDVLTPVGWLIGTARNLKLERCRKRWKHLSSSELLEIASDPNANATKPRFQFSRSQVWQSLSEPQKFAVTQVLMHDRVVSDIAEELGLNRSTVKSWVSRIPRRLANDSYFRSLLGKGVKNG